MTKFSRQQIYDMVWQFPMTDIAKKYVISDVGFRKLCLRLKIPIPKSGDWSKIKCGYKVKKPPLPTLLEGLNHAALEERPPGQPVKKISPLHQQVKKVSVAQLPFKVPQRLTNPDSLVLAAKESLSKSTDPNHPGMMVTNKGQLDIRVAPSNIGRALRFMDTLIKCIRARGYLYEVDQTTNFITIGDIRLRINFREQTTRHHVKNQPYKEFEWLPNGKLCFRLDSRLKASWTDLKTRSLEDQLPQILAKLELAAKQEVEYAVQAKLWQENWERQRKLQAEKEACQRREQQAFKALIRDAKRWKHAQLVREYLAATPDAEPDWIAWAQHKANWLDPNVTANDEWLLESDKDNL